MLGTRRDDFGELAKSRLQWHEIFHFSAHYSKSHYSNGASMSNDDLNQ